jgi:tol-pal system protein YbgF
MEGVDNRVTLVTDRLERVEISAGRAGAATPELPIIRLDRGPDRGAPPPSDDGLYVSREAESTEADAAPGGSEPESSRPSAWTGDSGTLGVWEPGAPPLGREEGLASMPKKSSRAKKAAPATGLAASQAEGDVPADLATERRTPGGRIATNGNAGPDPVDPGEPVPRSRFDGRDPMAQYKEGYRAVTTGSRAEGRELLFSFLLKYPRHELADNAMYWIGESYYAEESFSDALRYFQRILDEYPDSNKVPDAMVKAAITLQRAGELDQGRFLLNQVIKVYPGTQSAEVARQKLAEWTEGSPP